MMARLLTTALLLFAFVAMPAAASAQTAATLFQRATTREATARKTPTIAALRAAVTSYETVVRRYPRSSFCDDALWNGAELARFTYERFAEDADRATAERLYTWLRREYPTSAKAKLVPAQLTALAAPGAKPAAPAAAPAPARPTAKPPAAAPPAAPPVVTPTPAPTPAPPPGSPATLRRATLATLPHADRLTLEFDREAYFHSERLAGPDRAFLDVRLTEVPATVRATLEQMTASRVTAVRVGVQSGQTARIVVEFGGGTPAMQVFTLYQPYRIVIDVLGPAPAGVATRAPATPPPATPSAATSAPAATVAASAAPPSAASVPPVVAKPTSSTQVSTPASTPTSTQAPPQQAPKLQAPVPTPTPTTQVPPAPVSPTLAAVAPASTTSRGDYTLARQLGLGVSRIVIDAGHGGHDPGARGHGVVESALVLDIALRVEALLKKQPGMEVVLTRRTDVFIPLEERTAIANREGADLFLSIHANASTRAAARGVETYFLNFATNPEAEAVAARENATSGKSMGRLPELVQQITLNTKVKESRELAQIVQTNMIRTMRAQNKGVLDLGVKQAPFVVLIGAQMPSVLAEISFVTNKTEAGLLKNNAYKQRIAQALADAVLKYQASLKKSSTVASAK